MLGSMLAFKCLTASQPELPLMLGTNLWLGALGLARQWVVESAALS